MTMDKKILPLLALILPLLLASCARDLTPEEYLNRAEDAIAAGDLNAALIDLKSAAREAPNNLVARRHLAYVYLELGLGAEAEKEARRAVDLGLPANEAALLLIRSLYLRADYETLLEESDEFAGEPDAVIQGQIMAYRARALMELRDYPPAATMINVALELQPDSPLVLSTKASFEAISGNREVARNWADRALEADPNSSEAWALLGDLLAADYDWEGAVAAYNKAVENRGYPNIVNARRAMALLSLEQFDEADAAIASLERVGMGDVPYVSQVKGISAYLQKDYGEAAAVLDRALAGSPKNLTMKAYLAASLLELKRLEQASLILDQLYAAAPDSTEVSRMRAAMAIENADLRSARETMEIVLEKSGGEDITALGMLGALAMIEGDGDAAVGYFERLLEIEPTNEQAQAKLMEAQGLRGDFIARDLAAARDTVKPDEVGQVLLSAASAFSQGQIEEAMAIAGNLHRQYPDRTGPMIMMAAVQLSKGEWQTGRETLEKVLEIDPMEPSAVRNLAMIYQAMGENEKGKEILNTYLAKNPEDRAARAIQSQLIIATAEPAQAVQQLDDILREHPDDLSVRGRLVKLHFDRKEYAKVQELTESLDDEAIASQPILMELRGKSFLKLGQPNQAMNTWEKWLQISPNSVLANYYLFGALAAGGETDKAMQALRKSLDLNSNYLPARMAEIRMTALQGDLPEARALMDQLQSEVASERGEVYFLSGWLAIQEQDYTRTEAALEKSLQLNPTPEAVLLLSVTLTTQQRNEDSIALLEKWLPEFPSDLKLTAAQAQYYLVEEDTAKAIAAYERLLELAPNSILALNNLAWLKRESDPVRALAYVRQAHELVPEDPVVLDTYGNLLASGGQLDEAAQMLDDAVRLRPGNMQYKLNYARILLQAGKRQQAAELLGEVIEGSGDPQQVAVARSLLASSSNGVE